MQFETTVTGNRGRRAARAWGVVAASVLAGILTTAPITIATGQTLEDILAQSYQNNPDLRAARARLRATDEGVPQALSGWRPTVRVQGDAGLDRTEQDLGTPTSSGDTDYTQPRSGSLVIDQNLYRGGRTVAATRRAENTVKAERARLSSSEQTVLLDAVTAYMDVVRDVAIIDLNKNNVKVLERQLEATRDRFRVGEVTRTDVAQAESRLSRGRSDLVTAEGRLIQSRAAFRNVVGNDAGKLEPPKPPADLVKSQDEALARARTNNFNVLQTKFIEAAARDQVREVVGELLPLVTLQGELTKSQERVNRNSDTESASITARLTVPLYQAGGVSSRVREAKQVAVQRRDEFNQALRDALETASRSWEALITARSQIRAFSAEIRAAEIALEGVEQEALVGSRTVLDVLDAEQELFEAKVNLVSALRDEVVAAYSLRAATGDLTAQKLNLPVQVYDPEANYKRVRGKWFGLGVKEE